MSILFLLSFEKLHETALSMKIGTMSSLNRHQVGTKLGLSRDQVAVQSLTQLYKTPFSEQVIRYVTIQVTEQVSEHVAPANHRGHQDFAAEVGSQIESQFAAQGGVE